MKSSFILLLTTTFLTSTLLVAPLPLAHSQTSIRDLQRTSGVSVSGVVRSIVGNEFILDDGTGQIIVDAGPRWFHQINLNEGEQVRVVGEYDDYDFDAFSITRSNGEVIRIREGGGPPPWAGRRD